MNNTATKKQWFLVLLSVILITGIVAGGIITRPRVERPLEITVESEPVESESTEPLTKELTLPAEGNPLFAEMIAQIEHQAEVDEMLLAELNSGAYDFENPLVVVDPYSTSPLSALVLFTSDKPLNISVHVGGKTRLADVDFSFDGYNTSHQIPVYGLYPDELNTVELTAKTQSGATKRAILKIQTDQLPPELAQNIIQTDLVQPDNYQPGFNYTFRPKSVFDVNGEYRWFFNVFGLREGVIYDYNGNMVFAKGAGLYGDLLIFESNALGKVLSVFYSPYGVHHDIIAINNKNLIVTGCHGNTIDDLMYEVNVETGKITNTLDLKNILQRTRSFDAQYSTTADWFHQNAIVYENGEIIISGRHQSAVAKLTWPEGKLEWILGDHKGWNSMFEKYLLTPIGNNFEWQYAQHAPEILPDYDNNPDTIDILLFDNGNNRFAYDKELQRAIANNETVAPELYSRMVHYRINEKEKTVEQIWQFGKELGEKYFAARCGDANLLENENRLATFDVVHDVVRDDAPNFSAFIEATASGDIIWEAYVTTTKEASDYWAYRLERLPLYTFAANDLQIGIPAKNLIPQEVLEKYGYS